MQTLRYFVRETRSASGFSFPSFASPSASPRVDGGILPTRLRQLTCAMVSTVSLIQVYCLVDQRPSAFPKNSFLSPLPLYSLICNHGNEYFTAIYKSGCSEMAGLVQPQVHFAAISALSPIPLDIVHRSGFTSPRCTFSNGSM